MYRVDDDTVKRVVSLYAQGLGFGYISNELGISKGIIVNILKDVGLYRRGYVCKKDRQVLNICKTCGKLFESNQSRSYCYNPCDGKELLDVVCKSNEETSHLRYHFIKTIRKEFWDVLKSNPKEALKIENEMVHEEGPEFKDMVLDGITDTDEFNKMMDTYKKYKKVFEDEIE